MITAYLMLFFVLIPIIKETSALVLSKKYEIFCFFMKVHLQHILTYLKKLSKFHSDSHSDQKRWPLSCNFHLRRRYLKGLRRIVWDFWDGTFKLNFSDVKTINKEKERKWKWRITKLLTQGFQQCSRPSVPHLYQQK